MRADLATLAAEVQPKEPLSRKQLADLVKFAKARQCRTGEKVDRANRDHAEAGMEVERAEAALAQWDTDHPAPPPAEPIRIEEEPDPQLDMF